MHQLACLRSSGSRGCPLLLVCWNERTGYSRGIGCAGRDAARKTKTNAIEIRVARWRTCPGTRMACGRLPGLPMFCPTLGADRVSCIHARARHPPRMAMRLTGSCTASGRPEYVSWAGVGNQKCRSRAEQRPTRARQARHSASVVVRETRRLRTSHRRRRPAALPQIRSRRSARNVGSANAGCSGKSWRTAPKEQTSRAGEANRARHRLER